MRTASTLASLLLAVALAAACTAPGAEVTPEELTDGSGPVRVAAGPDAETLLLGQVLVELLVAAEIEAELVTYGDAREARQALAFGRVDLRPGYTGEAWLETLARPDPPGDPVASFEAVEAHDAEEGIVWLRPRFGDGLGEPPANATFAFVVQGPPSIDAALRTMSQLAARLSEQPEARVCVDQEFASRDDGLRALLSAYSVRSDREFLAADPEEAVLGVVAGDCLAGLTTATDGVAWRAGLRPLVDDLRVFPAFVPLPQVRAELLDERPEIGEAIQPWPAQLTTSLLGTWNAGIAGGESVADVAAAAALELRTLDGRIPAAEAANADPQ